MLREALDYLVRLAKVPTSAEHALDDGSERRYLFNQPKGEYVEIERYHHRQRSVSNIESYTAMTIAEAKRAGSKGESMTSIFLKDGADLHLDDKDGRTVFHYRRELSPAWQMLTARLGQPMEHADFVRFLQSLRPVLGGTDRTSGGAKYRSAGDIIGDYRALSFDSGVKIESAPILDAGKTGGSYAFTLQVRGKNADAEVPATIPFFIPYARGSENRYYLTAELLIDLKDKGPDRKVPVFSLIIPDLAAVAEEAVSDEVKAYIAATKSGPKNDKGEPGPADLAPVPDMLVLEDY